MISGTLWSVAFERAVRSLTSSPGRVIGGRLAATTPRYPLHQ